jgi:hypothetical protein
MNANNKRQAGTIAAAALLLPGLVPKQAVAQTTVPDQGLVSAKYLYYKDSQPDLDRITVKSPSFYALIPFAGAWSFEGSLVQDEVSGATPRYYSSVSGATKYNPATGRGGMQDERIAGDARLTGYFGSYSAYVSGAYSTEDDYTGRAFSVGGSWATNNNNTTYTAAVSASNDKMSSKDAVNRFGPADGKKPQDESRKVNELLFGVTQVFSAQDIVQANLTISRGKGYYTDPYKAFDARPDKRNALIGLLRWNHHYPQSDATLRTNIRLYDDSFGITSQTYGAEWAQNLRNGWIVTPGVRYYSQSASDFYKNPAFVLTSPTTGEYSLPGDTSAPFSADQRLSAFGAVTVSMKVSKELAKLWSVDGKAEYYQQRGEWYTAGKGSPGLDAFDATFIQLGVSRKF